MTTADRTCIVDGCTAVQQCRKMCNKHYLRLIRTGTTDARVPPHWQHGANGHERHGCDCEICWSALRSRNVDYRRRNLEALKAYDAARYLANPKKAQRKAAAAARYLAADKDELRSKKRAWNAAHPEKQREYSAAHFARDPERSRRLGRLQYQRNKERRRASSLRWAKNNPAAANRQAHVRRARLRGCSTFIVTARDWRRLCLRYGNACAYCGSSEPLTQDHIVPLSRGGQHSIGNLIPACRRCNCSKRTRLIVEWRRATAA